MSERECVREGWGGDKVGRSSEGQRDAQETEGQCRRQKGEEG